MSIGAAARAFASGRVSRQAAVTAAVLLCGITLAVAFLNKARCAGAPFRADGRSVAFDYVKDARVCYSDIQFLWLGRDIDQHIFPYVHGGITADGALTGGAVEYPVLSGLLMWLGALGANNDAMFLLQSALLLAPFALLTAWLLARMAGRAALLWAVGPPLVLYAFHNWELPVVFTTVAAMAMMTLSRRPLRRRAIYAAVLLGLGFCFKIYPAIFVAPLMLYVLTGGERGRADSDRTRLDIRGALYTGAAAATTVLVVNLPFAIAGYEGWRASIVFQQQRQADITTNSIWFWGLRPLFGTDRVGTTAFADTVAIASPALIVASFVLALWIGRRRYLETGVYPWIGVSGAMLCGFLVFHKVHSPQYTLWLIPFLVVLAVPWPVVWSYLLADIAIGVGVFRYFYAMGTGHSVEVMEAVVRFGVWGRATLLVFLFTLFLRVPLRVPWERVARADAQGPAVANRFQ
ncbi:glycosyltransferase 87 family protein [Nocardia carnea]|uniref:glycosyltransferase 87 family protein n=1 Tax=Nocardia carnea TaxID=37328 RepID=UPI0024579D6D|nr:glycosyltransferase 87 family protein [Nocardia carnea]